MCRGNDHWTKDCTNREMRHCVSCNTNDHVSWSRSCPIFLMKWTDVPQRTTYPFIQHQTHGHGLQWHRCKTLTLTPKAIPRDTPKETPSHCPSCPVDATNKREYRILGMLPQTDDHTKDSLGAAPAPDKLISPLLLPLCPLSLLPT